MACGLPRGQSFWLWVGPVAAVVISLLALFVGTGLLAVAGALNLGQTTDAAVLRWIGTAGAVLFYPGLAGFVLWLLSLLFSRSND